MQTLRARPPFLLPVLYQQITNNPNQISRPKSHHEVSFSAVIRVVPGGNSGNQYFTTLVTHAPRTVNVVNDHEPLDRDVGAQLSWPSFQLVQQQHDWMQYPISSLIDPVRIVLVQNGTLKK
jgi:hypothetical protein